MNRVLGIIGGIAVAFAAGYVLHMLVASDSADTPSAVTSTPEPASAHPEDAEVEVWTCSMHPQIRMPKPGKCPICGMDLIPVESDAAIGPRQYETSEVAKKLMEIQTVRVERRFVTAEVRLFGKVDYDETKLGYITAWVPGRLDRMYVDFTGVPVRKGDHMVVLYSPQLLAAQTELLQAKEAIKELERSRIEIMKENARAMLEAAREKLRLWGLSREQIAALEKTGKPSDHIEINAPMSGIVIEKHAQQGMYVNTGTRLYTIADLQHVWVKLDAYESDLKWLRYGQKATFTTEAYPGEKFVGTIAFIAPVVDAKTRTIKVRVNVPNEDGKLKPDMFVSGIVSAQVAAGGRVMDPDLSGKWICYMHPEVVKDAVGKCDICEMPLVRTESLGYVAAAADEKARPLVIPASAPLITGKRAVVYVEVPGTDRPTYEGREVVLGPRAGDYYIVERGLKEGEEVVTHGSFKIDSALQIQAKPSMMQPEGGLAPTPHQHGAHAEPGTDPGDERKFLVPQGFRKQLSDFWQSYRVLSSALASDDAAAAARALENARGSLDRVDMRPLEGEAHETWMKALANLRKSLAATDKAKDIHAVRAAFALLSAELEHVIRRFGLADAGPVYKLHCPMAFNNRGADWLQNVKEVRNPYFGAAMPKCGDVVETISTRPRP